MNEPAPMNPAMMGPDSGAEEPSAEGYCIKIEVRADGTFSVGKYPIDDEGRDNPPMQAGMGGLSVQPEQGDGAQEFTDVAEAFKAAAKLYQQNPITESEQDHMRAAYGAQPPRDADMAAGYSA